MKRCFLISGVPYNLSWLKDQVGRADTVIPIGLGDLILLKDCLGNVQSVEDFVPYKEITRLAERANNIAQLASRRFLGEFFKGYNWPEMCWNTQLYFFRDILLAEALASSLEDSGFDKICWVGNPAHHFAYYFATVDTVQSALEFYLGNRLEVFQPSILSRGRSLNRYRETLKHLLHFMQKYLLDDKPDISKCQTVAIFTATEWERFTDAIEDLSQGYGKEFNLWYFGGIPEKLKDFVRSRRIKSVSIGYPDTAGKDVKDFFARQWQFWLAERRFSVAEETNCRFLSSDLIQYHFAFYFRTFWPRMAQWGIKLEEYLKIARPDRVISSAAYSHLMAIAYCVALKLGISSVALPHSCVPGGHGILKSSFLVCRNRFERENFRRPFPDDDRVWFCGNGGNELSYTPTQVTIGENGRRIIGILTAEPDSEGSLMVPVHRANFLETWKEMFSPPLDLSDVDILIKSHPRSDISLLLKKLNVKGTTNVMVLDSSSPVKELMEKAWVVVLGNHYGGVVAQAIQSGKPLIFLETAKHFWPHMDKLAFEAGEVVEDMAAFWDLIRQLKDSPALHKELSSKCQRFREAYLQPASQTLGKYLRLIEKQPVSLSTKTLQTYQFP
jgi:hypothetical protein